MSRDRLYRALGLVSTSRPIDLSDPSILGQLTGLLGEVVPVPTAAQTPYWTPTLDDLFGGVLNQLPGAALPAPGIPPFMPPLAIPRDQMTVPIPAPGGGTAAEVPTALGIAMLYALVGQVLTNRSGNPAMTASFLEQKYPDMARAAADPTVEVEAPILLSDEAKPPPSAEQEPEKASMGPPAWKIAVGLGLTGLVLWGVLAWAKRQERAEA